MMRATGRQEIARGVHIPKCFKNNVFYVFWRSHDQGDCRTRDFKRAAYPKMFFEGDKRRRGEGVAERPGPCWKRGEGVFINKEKRWDGGCAERWRRDRRDGNAQTKARVIRNTVVLCTVKTNQGRRQTPAGLRNFDAEDMQKKASIPLCFSTVFGVGKSEAQYQKRASIPFLCC